MSNEFSITDIFEQNKILIQNYEYLINAIRKTQARLDRHEGGRGNNNTLHAIATFETDGFLSHFDKQTIDFKGRYAQTIAVENPDQPQNILSLGIGLYIGRYFTNLPEGVDDSLKIISVTGAGQGQYKVIKLYWVAANKEYTRMVHTTIDSGWYSGNFTNVPLLNGYEGTLLVRRERLHTLTSVEIIFEITRAEGVASVPFAKLGEGFSNTSNLPIAGQAFGTVTGNTLTAPLTFLIGRNSEMTLFRQTTTQSYDRATGHLIFYR